MDDGGIQFAQQYQAELEYLEWQVAALNSDISKLKEKQNGTNRNGITEQLQASTGRAIHGDLLPRH